MSRRIVSTQYQAASKATVDTYFDKVIKFIPADIVGAWIAVTGLISSDDGAPQSTLLWITFAVGAVLTLFWTLKQTSVPKKKPAITQAGLSTGAFIVWIFALGGPFATLSFYRPLYGSLALIFYTLAVGLVTPIED